MRRFRILNILFLYIFVGVSCSKDTVNHSDIDDGNSVITTEDTLSEQNKSNVKIYSQGVLKIVFKANTSKFDSSFRNHLAQLYFNVYPKIRQRFNTDAPKKIVIKIDTTGKGGVQTVGNVITFGASYFNVNPNDIDELIHQLAYIALTYSNQSPTWLVEGIANYIRYTYGVQNEKAGWGLPDYNPDKIYDKDSMVALRFLVWLENNVNTKVVNRLSALMSKGLYTSSVWTNITWRTLDDLWTAYSINPNLSDSISYKKKKRNQAAKQSVAALNYWFYNKNRKLYYLNTTHSRIASGWTQAVFFHILMDAYEMTESPVYLSKIEELYRGAKKKYSDWRWEDVKYVNGWIYDDMMWWVIALAQAYEVTGEQKFLDDAIAGFDFVWNESYDPVVGGMRWSWKVIGKNACVNYPTVIGAMRLYHITGKEKYFSKAKMIYAWSRNVFFQESTGRVADHKVGNDPVGFEDYTYNQGTCIGAALLLYKATGKEMYLEDAKRAANYTITQMCNKDGILPAEEGEGGVFKSIFINYMSKLIKNGKQYQYLSWLEKNAKTAWGNRDTDRDICFTNYTIPCPKGVVSSYNASSAVKLLLSLVNLKTE